MAQMANKNSFLTRKDNINNGMNDDMKMDQTTKLTTAGDENDDSDTVSHPVDRGWAWIILIAAMVSLFLINGLFRSFGILYVEFKEVFGASDTSASSIQAVQNVAYSMGAILNLTIGLQYLTCRQCVMIGGILISLSYALGSFANDIRVIYFTYSLSGVGTAFSFSATILMVGTYFDKRRGLANGFIQSFGSLGTLLIGPAIRHFLDVYTLKGALLILGGLSAHLIASGVALRPTSFYSRRKRREEISLVDKNEILSSSFKSSDRGSHLALKSKSNKTLFNNGFFDSPVAIRKRDSEQINDIPAQKLPTYVSDEHLMTLSMADVRPSDVKDDIDSISNNGKIKWRRKIMKYFNYKILKNSAFLRFLVAYVVGSVGISIPIFYLPAYAHEQEVVNVDVTVFISIYACVDVLGRLLSGIVSDTGYMKRQYLCALGLTFNGVVMSLANWYTDFWTFVLFATFYGLFGGIMPALYAALLLDILGLENLRSGLLMMYMMQGVFLGTVSPFIGQLRDVTGTYFNCYMLIGALCIFSSLFLWIEILPCMERKYKTSKNKGSE